MQYSIKVYGCATSCEDIFKSLDKGMSDGGLSMAELCSALPAERHPYIDSFCLLAAICEPAH